jgi:hypothetical protein
MSMEYLFKKVPLCEVLTHAGTINTFLYSNAAASVQLLSDYMITASTLPTWRYHLHIKM